MAPKRKKRSKTAGPVDNRPTKKIVSADEIKQKTAIRLRSYRFQTALLQSDRKAALTDEFRTTEIDNSRCWLHGHTNPVRLWSIMKAAADAVTVEEEADSIELFDLLMRTGAEPFVNVADPKDAKRPIDASNPAQRPTLVRNAQRYGIDVNPTSTHSPLYIFINLKAGRPFIDEVVDRMRPESLDWIHPTKNNTAFHLALSKSIDQARGVAELLVPYAAVGYIDPYQACFNDRPIPETNPASLSILAIARGMYDEFESVHRLSAIADVVPDLLSPLVGLVGDYARHT